MMPHDPSSDGGQIDRAVDEIDTLRAALVLACEDGWGDGEHVADLYVEKAQAARSATADTPSDPARSANYLIVKACEELLETLIPVAELRLTRRPTSSRDGAPE